MTASTPTNRESPNDAAPSHDQDRGTGLRAAPFTGPHLVDNPPRRASLGLNEPLLSAIVARIRSADAGYIQSVICFGSQASGRANSHSDVDILVLVDAPELNWGPRENIAERKRLEYKIGRLPVRLDLWVRTIDQYEESRSVIGCYEYAASSTGTVLCSRPAKRIPAIRRSREDIRYGNVCAWLELSRRLLGRSVQLTTVSFVRDGRWLSPAHYAWRACMAAMGALFVWRQIDIPSKYDELPTWLDKLRSFEPEALPKLTAAFEQVPLSANLAQALLRTVAEYLAQDERLRSRTQQLTSYLAQPVELLAAVPSLKQ